jgi:hypothetical protein
MTPLRKDLKEKDFAPVRQDAYSRGISSRGEKVLIRQRNCRYVRGSILDSALSAWQERG